MSNCIQHVQPKKDCEICHGWGMVSDEVDYGDTRVHIQDFCDCVTVQAENDDVIIVIEPQHDGDVDFDDFQDYDPIMSKEEETLLAIDMSSETLEEWQAKEDAYFAKYVRTP